MKAATGGALTGLTGVIEGVDSVAGKVAALVSAFQDANGDAVFPTLTATGAIPVDEPGICLRSVGPNPTLAGTATQADITNSAVTLTPSKVHSNIEGWVYSASESEFEIVQVDDATTTVLGTIAVGPGQTTLPFKFHCLQATAGATGTQELKLRGKNCDPNQLSDMFGWLGVKQAP